MPALYASLPTGQIFDRRSDYADTWLADPKYSTRFLKTAAYVHRGKTVYEITGLTYGSGWTAFWTLAVTVILSLVSAIITAIAGGLMFVNADDHANNDIVKRWSAVLMIGAPVLFVGAALWYGFMPRALAYSLVNALVGGLSLIIFACNVLLLQWVEGHAMDHVHTRYNGADGVLEAAFVLHAFKLALFLSNILAGLYADLDWRPTPREMARTLYDRKELEQDVGANTGVLERAL